MNCSNSINQIQKNFKTVHNYTRYPEHGHSKTHCNKPFSFVKRDQQHDSKSYTEHDHTKENTSHMCLRYPANYKSRQVYKQLMQAKNQTIRNELSISCCQTPPQDKLTTNGLKANKEKHDEVFEY
ncbi:hypothetical protein WA026_006302 [Henosepilachna vigintioctopunctata]|uniref:Uncharacterized protein n=1 Tax=Henosepilachna vigintioctopunctata TaxID=420089 RepID=A0AAW1TPF0_9CUCU